MRLYFQRIGKSQTIFSEKGDNIRGIIEIVELRGNKPRIILSRTAPAFLEKLFEQEIT